MNDVDPTRRTFLRGGVALAGSSMLRFSAPALAALSQAAHARKTAAAPFETLTEAEARELEAIAARILPTTDTPGAREAGVIYFFDQTFATFNAPSLAVAREGLAKFLASVPDGVRFSELAEPAQDAYLATRDTTEFFELCRFMTLCGFFGLSEYGGNRDDVGWKLIGVTPHQHAFVSPFGYYDAEHQREHPDA